MSEYGIEYAEFLLQDFCKPSHCLIYSLIPLGKHELGALDSRALKPHQALHYPQSFVLLGIFVKVKLATWDS